MMECRMCGKHTSHFETRWYIYDNGEQFKTQVCMDCAKLHDWLVKR